MKSNAVKLCMLADLAVYYYATPCNRTIQLVRLVPMGWGRSRLGVAIPDEFLG